MIRRLRPRNRIRVHSHAVVSARPPEQLGVFSHWSADVLSTAHDAHPGSWPTCGAARSFMKYLDLVPGGNGASQRFLQTLGQYFEANGARLLPPWQRRKDGAKLDLLELFRLVAHLGGYQAVTATKCAVLPEAQLPKYITLEWNTFCNVLDAISSRSILRTVAAGAACRRS